MVTKNLFIGVGVVLAGILGANIVSHTSTCLLTGTPKNGTRQETRVENIGFRTKTINNSHLLVGQSRIIKAGVNGSITHTFTVTYTKCKEATRTEISTKRTKPKDQTVSKGTKEVKKKVTHEIIHYTTTYISDYAMRTGESRVAQSGVNGVITHYFRVTYVSGREIARKEINTTRIKPQSQLTYLGAAPYGASAICSDNTYSFSANHSGTCSWHGGVSQWVY